MMNLPAIAFVLPLAACAVTSEGPQHADARPSERGMTLYVGQRSLDNDYEPVEDQLAFGLEYAAEPAGWTLGYEVGLGLSEDDGRFMGVDVEGETKEIYAGVRKSFVSPASRVRPYVGIGLTWIEADFTALGLSVDDASIAGYLHGGLAFALSPQVSIGVDVRTVVGSDLDLAGVNTDADYGQIAVTFGYSF